MGVKLMEIGVKVGKDVIFIVRGCFKSVCDHPFLVVMLFFLIFLYRSSPFIFQLLVSISPILVCTAVLLGTLLSFGQPDIPDIGIEEKTAVETVSVRTGVLGDTTLVEENESHYVEGFSESRWDETEKPTERPEMSFDKLGEVRREEDSDYTARLIIEESVGDNGVVFGAKREVGELTYKEKMEWIEERLNNLATRVNNELIESNGENSEADSFDSEKVNVDSLDSPPRSPWARVEEREDEEKESDNEQDEDDVESSDSGSDHTESSSPDASMTDIMPMLDELHPLLDEEPPQTVRLSSDAASEKSLKSIATSHQSDNESENHEDEAADEMEEEDARGDKDEETKSAITWTEEDQKNLMDLGSSEIERNLRLENIILRRRARKSTSLLAERNMIDLVSSDIPFNIAPISAWRQNPFDLPDNDYDNSLPPIPGSAPSVLLPRRNPFDILYDSTEEKPDLKGDGFQEEFTSQSREPMFRRHESFNLRPSIFAPKKQDVKMMPYFVPERTISSSSSLLQRQSSELSAVSSVDDLDEKKLLDSVPERGVDELAKEVTEEGPSGLDTEEDARKEPEMVSKMESVSEYIGYGNRSLEEEDSLELGLVEKRDVGVGTDHYEQGRTTHGSDFEGVEPRYTRDSSSSSLSEVNERVFIDTEGEGLSMLGGRIDDGAEEPTLSAQTSLGSIDLNITSTLVHNISHRAAVYDSSPRELYKNQSEGSIQEVEMDIPHNIEMLPDSSTSHPVAAECRPVKEHGADENLTATTSSAEGNTSHFHDSAIQKPGFNYPNEVQAPSTPVESFLDDQITWDLNTPEVEELNLFMNSPSSPKFVSVPPSAFEKNSSTVDARTAVEETDEIKEIDDGLLCELDNVGDFTVGQLGSGEHVDSAGEESTSSTYCAETSTTRLPEVQSVEVNKIQHLLLSEASREDVNVYDEQDVEHISELTSVETEIVGEVSDVSCQGQVETNTTSGMAEEEVQLAEDVHAVPKHTELTSVEIEIVTEGANVSSQGQVNTDTTCEIEASSTEAIDLELKHISSKDIKNRNVLEPVEIEASSVEAINLAFKHIGSEEIKNRDVLEPLQPELVVRETISGNSEDAVPHRERDTIEPVSTNQVFDGEMPRQLKLKSDDESVEVKVDYKIGPSDIKEGSAFEAEKPNYEDEAPKDLHASSSVKGKGKLSRS